MGLFQVKSFYSAFIIIPLYCGGQFVDTHAPPKVAFSVVCGLMKDFGHRYVIQTMQILFLVVICVSNMRM